MRSIRRGRPRLIHLADYGAAYSGSFIPMLMAIATAAQREGWAVELIFSELSRESQWLADLDRAGIRYRFLRARRSGLKRWRGWITAEVSFGRRQDHTTEEITSILNEAKTETILHTHFSTFDVAAAHAARKVPQTFVVWHHHSMRRPGWKPMVGGTLNYRLFARNVSEFLCVAPDVVEVVRRYAPHDRVRFVPNAIDARRFSLPTVEQRSRARARLGITPSDRVLLQFGSDWLRKGGDVYLGAIRLLVDESASHQIRAVIVGTDEARAAVEDAELRSVVSVVEPTEAVQDLYAASDVLVSPSRSEGMPLALLEALAMGLPVVASDIPGQAFVAKAVSACRLSSLSPTDLARSIREVVDLDPAQRAHEQSLARRWILNHMSLDSWVQTLMETYERIRRPRLQ